MSHLLTEDLNRVLRCDIPFKEELFKTRIFITGGTGFIGKWFLETFCRANEEFGLDAQIYVLTRNPRVCSVELNHLIKKNAIHFIEGDIRTFDFFNEDVNWIIHGACDANYDLICQDPFLVMDTIVLGTRRLLEFAKLKQPKRILFLSSGAVYGSLSSSEALLSEEHVGCVNPHHPYAVYSEAKRLAELSLYLAANNYGVQSVIARCFAFVGPFLPLDRHFAIGNFLSDGLSGRKIRVHGDGTAYRSYLYAADMAAWLWKLFFHGKPLHPYNVGSERAYTLEEVANLVGTICGQNVDICLKSDPSRIPDRYVPSTQRAKEDCGLKEWISLEEAILRTANWHRARESLV